MLQQINKKILLYLFLFIILGTINNKNLEKFDFPKIDLIQFDRSEVDDNNFLKKLELIKQKNLFFLDKFQIKEVFNNNYLIEEYKIFKRYPSSLEIEIVKTRFYALTNIDGKIFFIGSNGKLIQANNDLKNLPFIFGYFDIKNFLNLKRIIDESDLDFKQIQNLYSFPSGRWDIETLSGILIKLSKDEPKDSLDLALNLLMDEKFRDVKLIDVRQKNQVITNE